MPPRPRLRRPHDWAAIRRDYESGERTVQAICTAHAVSEWEFYEECKRAGWTLRCPRRPPPVTSSETELSARLLNALDEKMRQFEKRLQQAQDSGNAADSERDARTLSTLVRLFERLTGMAGARAAPAARRSRRPDAPEATDRAFASPDTAPTKDPHDQERLRGELARRLDTLRTQIGG